MNNSFASPAIGGRGIFLMRCWLTLLLFFHVATLLIAQNNLVPNPSFEDTTFCPTGNVYKAVGWFSPTLGTPDIFRNTDSIGACWEFCQWVGVGNYANGQGYQLPSTGRAYAGMKTLGSVPGATREYITIQLSDTLEAGKRYCVSFYTSLANTSGFAFDKIGVLLTATPNFDCANSDPIISNSGITNQQGNVILDTLNWILVSDTFVAVGGEVFLTLGNFRDDSDLQIVSTGTGGQFSYHYFDDVEVVYCDTIVEQPPVYSEITLLPNPSNGNFIIAGNFPFGTELKIYNMLGQQVCNTITLPEGNANVPIYSFLAQGVYYCRVDAEGVQLKEEKIVVVE